MAHALGVAERLLQRIHNVQRARRGEFRFKGRDLSEFYWAPEKFDDRLNKLVAVEKAGDSHRLAKWRDFAQR